MTVAPAETAVTAARAMLELARQPGGAAELRAAGAAHAGRAARG